VTCLCGCLRLPSVRGTPEQLHHLATALTTGCTICSSATKPNRFREFRTVSVTGRVVVIPREASAVA
jgi:hypothetical protein